LRSEADRQACVRGLADGTIDCIATDHAPHATTDKTCEFDLAAPGISGIETALAVVLALDDPALPVERIVEALTIGPVRALGLDRFLPDVGTLAPGAPADAVLFDQDARWTVDPTEFASLGKNTPFRGREVCGRVIATVFDGTLSYVNQDTLVLASGSSR
jgi:dihydroorotase